MAMLCCSVPFTSPWYKCNCVEWKVIFQLPSESSACSDTRGDESSRTSVCFPEGEGGRVALSHLGIPVLSQGHMMREEGRGHGTDVLLQCQDYQQIKDGI
ncbi:hypothetical protein EYF80_000999 [Liparis tanakae]|uniref:Uncharacterized protein n=1 Tax=Liparis tanakae TaxID=230148 RepID=A0A4Z2JFB0_9TELE|nr:hypothetical protein EYF80_000999 [Liparis tanakae]